MCDPVSIGVAVASTALSAGGAMLNQREEQKNQQRMMDAARGAAEAERIRQQGYQDQATPVFNQSLDANAKDKQLANLAADQAKRVEATKSNVSQSSEYNPPLASAPSVVNSEIGRKMAEALTKANTNATNKANLNAWGDLSLGNKLAFADSNNQLNTINNFSKGSLRLLPLEQKVAANNAWRPNSGFGDILSFGGKALGLAGGLGAFNGLGSAGTVGMPSTGWNGGMWGDTAIYGLY